METTEAIKSISQKHSLHIDKTGLLAEVTGLVMVGLLPMKDFIPEITQKLQISKEQASAIADDVNTQIFIKIRELIQQAAEGKKDGIQAFGPEHLPSVENKNLFEQKMGQLFRIPREEVDLDGKKCGPDPYLEPLQ